MEKNLSFLALIATATLSGSVLAEEVDVNLYGATAILSGVEKNYTQTGDKALTFEGGQLTFIMSDGYVILATCVYDPSFAPIPPVVNLCPIGSTGFVASGDIDGDGSPDPTMYYSLSSVVGAQVFAPGYPERVSLIAAPASKLPRPLSAFGDYSLQVFYNTNDPTHLFGYDISGYRGIAGPSKTDNALRYYTADEQDKCEKENVNGVYIYTLPRVSYPDIALTTKFTKYAMMEVYSKKYKQASGFRLSNVVWSNDGAALFDPRIVKTLKWTGPSISNIVSTDESYIQLQAGDSANAVTFREFPGDGAKANLLSPYLTSYNMAPGFFTPGDNGKMFVEYQRMLDEGLFYDRSSRKINVDFRMVDSYDGFVTTKLVATGLVSTAKQALATLDNDGDGISNGLEFATQSVTEEALNSSARANYVVRDGGETDHYAQLYTYNNGKYPFSLAVANDPLTTKVPENALDKTKYPDFVGPYLDADNHVVLEVPVRPLMDDLATFNLQTLSGFKKGKATYKNTAIKGKYTMDVVTSATPQTVTRRLAIWVYNALTDTYRGVTDTDKATYGISDFDWYGTLPSSAAYTAGLYRPAVDINYYTTKLVYRSINPYTGTTPLKTWAEYWANTNDADPTNDPLSKDDCPIIGVSVALKSH